MGFGFNVTEIVEASGGEYTLTIPHRNDDCGRVVSLTTEQLRAAKEFFYSYYESGDIFDMEMYEYFCIHSNLGLRPAEYYELQIGDIDFENATIKVCRAGKNHMKGPKQVGATKTGTTRVLPLSEGTLDIMRGIVERFKKVRQTTPQMTKDILIRDNFDEISNFLPKNSCNFNKNVLPPTLLKTCHLI